MVDAAAAAPSYIVECQKHENSFPDVRVMQPAELSALLAAGKPVTLLDCRTPEERAVSTLRGAIAPDELRDALAKPDPGPLVVYCTVGYRSSLEARRIAASPSLAPAAGVFSMPGVLAWAHAGGELVDPATGESTRRLHCFGEKWASMAPSDVEAISFPPTKTVLRTLPVVAETVKDYVLRAVGWR